MENSNFIFIPDHRIGVLEKVNKEILEKIQNNYQDLDENTKNKIVNIINDTFKLNIKEIKYPSCVLTTYNSFEGLKVYNNEDKNNEN